MVLVVLVLVSWDGDDPSELLLVFLLLVLLLCWMVMVRTFFGSVTELCPWFIFGREFKRWSKVGGVRTTRNKGVKE